MIEGDVKLLAFEPEYTYRCELMRVVDGDTMDLLVDLGFHIKVKIRVRLQYFDAPEPRGDTREEGLHYSEKAWSWFEDSRGPFFVTTTKAGKFGRWLARIFVNLPEDDNGASSRSYLEDHLRADD